MRCIEVWFDNDKFIDICLFDHDPIPAWFEHFRKFSDTGYYKGGFLCDRGYGVFSKDIIPTQWNIILDAINKLTKMEYKFPFQVPKEFDYDQELLNKLHRFFTYNVMAFKSKEPNPFDPEFKMPSDINFEYWLGLVDEINGAVHKLENFSKFTENKTFFSTQLPLTYFFVNGSTRHPANITPWVEFTKEELKHNYTYFEYDLPLVLLDKSILGKCALQSFLEDDDLNAKDCTGRLGSYGGFTVDINDNRKKIYRSEPFKNWLTKHNRTLEDTPLEYPIGYVKNYEEVLSWANSLVRTMKPLKLKKIVFVD
jgi:hypothetical protein